MGRKPTIVCVYQSGKIYDSGHVKRLYDQVRRHAPSDVSFKCLTDDEKCVRSYGIETIRLRQRWRRYWCKMEVLRVVGPVLYMDLDVTILGDIAAFLEAAETHRFVVIRHPIEIGINSSIMAWSGDISELYRKFVEAPQAYVERYRKGLQDEGRRHVIGDQGFIGEKWKHGFAYWQDIVPGMLLSYKLHWLGGEDRSRCRVVYFHGRPRPWDVDNLSDV